MIKNFSNLNRQHSRFNLNFLCNDIVITYKDRSHISDTNKKIYRNIEISKYTDLNKTPGKIFAVLILPSFESRILRNEYYITKLKTIPQNLDFRLPVILIFLYHTLKRLYVSISVDNNK